MTTIADSIKATLDAQWTAAGGAEPTLKCSEDLTIASYEQLASTDHIIILHHSYDREWEPITASRSTQKFKIHLLVMTSDATNKEVRLDTMVTETVRLIHAMTTWDRIKVIHETRDKSERTRSVYVADLTVEIENYAEAI